MAARRQGEWSLGALRQKAVLSFAFLYYFITFLGAAAYLVALVHPNRWKLGFGRTCAVVIVAALSLAHVFATGWEGMLRARFFWGWLAFLVFFLAHPAAPGLERFLKIGVVVLCVYTLFEAVLINTVVDPSTLPNFPADRASASSHFATGGYQRPYSFGGNATVTATVLIAMALLLPPSLSLRALVVITVIVIGSATGILLLSVLVWRTLPIGRARIAALVATGAAVASYLVLIPADLFGRSKISVDYLTAVYADKAATLAVYRPDAPTFLFGTFRSGTEYGGDFALHSLLLSFGLVGLFAFAYLVARSAQRRVAFPLAVLLLGAIHYGGPFSLPGQVIFGLVLAGGISAAPPRSTRDRQG